MKLYYSFDGGVVKDLSQDGENNREGVAENVEYSNDYLGIQNRAIDFSGNGKAIVKIKDTSLFNFGDRMFGVSFWVKGPEIGRDWGTIIGNKGNKGI